MASSPVHAAPDRANPQQLLGAARALVPHIIASRDEASRRADVLPETIAAIQAAGLLRAFQPARWGGLELDPRHLFDLQNVFAEHCLSTAWVFGVLSVQSFMLGRMDPLAQSDVWGNDPDALVSSSFAPVGRVTPVDGGYRISGRFTFSSGSTHAKWAVVGGMVPPDDARPAPQMRLFLVPMEDYRIDRVWDTFGLRATGSNDLVIEDAFVPAYRHGVPLLDQMPQGGVAVPPSHLHGQRVAAAARHLGPVRTLSPAMALCLRFVDLSPGHRRGTRRAHRVHRLHARKAGCVRLGRFAR
ncbi:MAG: hypothetical protein V4521_03520 [Pseudomonadota bacterium]